MTSPGTPPTSPRAPLNNRLLTDVTLFSVACAAVLAAILRVSEACAVASFASAAACFSVPRAAITACCARYNAARALAVAICVPLSCASARATSFLAAVINPAVAEPAEDAILPKYRATPIATRAPAAVATVSILFATPFIIPVSVFVAPLASFAPPTQAIKAFSTLVAEDDTVSGMAAYSSRSVPS